jgi:hypothetical protein
MVSLLWCFHSVQRYGAAAVDDSRLRTFRRRTRRRPGAASRAWYHDLQQPDIYDRIPKKEETMANEGYHEPVEELSDETRDMHRAIISLMEELEAVDWYNQRIDATNNKELAAILAHNRDEEKEHAAMVLEWIRRRDPRFDKELKDYLFTTEEIAHE